LRGIEPPNPALPHLDATRTDRLTRFPPTRRALVAKVEATDDNATTLDATLLFGPSPIPTIDTANLDPSQS
jgi:hypothetical protein